MKYAKIVSLTEATSVPERIWQLVCKRSSLNNVRRQGCIRTLKDQIGCFVFTGGMFVQIKELRSVNGVYWITLILADGGEHHSPLGQYFDIFLAPQNTVSV